MAKSEQLKQLLENRKLLAARGIIGLILSYALFTRAVDTGSLFQYGVVILFLTLSVRLLVRAAQTKRNDSKR